MISQFCILIVDDNQATLRLTEMTLKNMGFKNILVARNGEEGFETVLSNKIDLVISDWNMPKLSGIELLKKIRENDKVKDTPFIMQTSERSQANIVEAVNLKVDSYIIKPYDTDVLKTKLKEVLKTRKIPLVFE